MANPQPVPAPEAFPIAGKSPDAFRTISEVASELDLPQHVLRFWETRFSVIKPLKRNGGRRYYRPEDVALLRQIRDLLRDKGYTIKGVQKLLRGGSTRLLPAVPLDIPPATEDPPASPQVEIAATAGEVPTETEGSALPGAGMQPAQRAELQAVLAELETLQTLLRGR